MTPVYPIYLHSPTVPLPGEIHPKEELPHYILSSQDTPVESSIQPPMHSRIPVCPTSDIVGSQDAQITLLYSRTLLDPTAPWDSSAWLWRIPLYHRMQQCQQTPLLSSATHSSPHSSHPSGCPGGNFFPSAGHLAGTLPDSVHDWCLLQQQSQVFQELMLRTLAFGVVSPPSRCCIVARALGCGEAAFRKQVLSPSAHFARETL